jgi:hypothetical protein
MRYLGARQRKSDNKWDYTTMYDKQVYPIGYCHEWTPYGYPLFQSGRAEMLNRQEAPFIENYHTDGHGSKEEACECYKKYLLDHSFRISTDSSTKQKCQVCNEWTQTRLEIGSYRQWVLCEKHANREEVEKLFSVGESWES